MVTCPKCGSSEVVTQMVDTGGTSYSSSTSKTKKSGNGFGGHVHNFNRSVLAVGTFGVSNLFVKKAKGNEKTSTSSSTTYKPSIKKISVCQKCGYSFDLDREEARQRAHEKYEKLIQERENRAKIKAEKAAQRKAEKASREKVPVFQQSWLIALVTFFLPPLGIFLIVKYVKSDKKKIWLGVSIVWAVIIGVAFIAALVDPNSSKGGSSAQNTNTVECKSWYDCSKLDDYSSDDIKQKLADMGVGYIQKVGKMQDGKVELVVGTDTQLELLLEIVDNTLAKISNKKYPDIIYYSADSGVETVKYPALELIAEEDKVAECEKDVKCKAIKEYGGQNLIDLLASMGITEFNWVNNRNGLLDISAKVDYTDANKLTVIADVDHNVVLIENADYDVIYYSTYEEDNNKTFEYPALDEIARIKELQLKK